MNKSPEDNRAVSGNNTGDILLVLTFCAVHVQWPLRLSGHACCCTMAPEMSVTESEDIKELVIKERNLSMF